jgi:hypothetical protein
MLKRRSVVGVGDGAGGTKYSQVESREYPEVTGVEEQLKMQRHGSGARNSTDSNSGSKSRDVA